MSEYDRLKKMKDEIVAKEQAEVLHESAMEIMQLHDANTRLAAELATLRARLEEAEALLKETEWMDSDTVGTQGYCWKCSSYPHNHAPDCELAAWLAKYPEVTHE